MSFIDWNGNGMHDAFDDMLEFMIFQDVMEEDGDTAFEEDEDNEDY